MSENKLLVLSLILGTILTIGSSAQPGGPEAEDLQRIAEAIVGQLDLAHQEAVFGALAPNIGALKHHAQRVINVIEGKNGPAYRAGAGDVGDGVGVLGHLQQLREKIRSTPLAPIFMLGLDAVLFDINAALEQSKQALTSGALHRARFALRLSRALVYSARGSASDPVGEGGARAILTRLNAGR
ncbi:hypothetical protein LM602_03095 [Candidatus Acetothermia bacterium]|jgi:hypothetical protein|nr:hypothetical protein [Candidatus Acetothermia bacterium]MCI2431530.1 hypothetical protein [Candidatus Acetothermia bacterium]MCI2436200.1 hypothetical protein [Candidatus Acetothermia bacterium]